LQEEYITRILDGLDCSELWQYAYDKFSEELDEYNDERLTQEIQANYPDLLENN
jgi:hypothetical protein